MRASIRGAYIWGGLYSGFYGIRVNKFCARASLCHDSAEENVEDGANLHPPPRIGLSGIVSLQLPGT